MTAAVQDRPKHRRTPPTKPVSSPVEPGLTPVPAAELRRRAAILAQLDASRQRRVASGERMMTTEEVLAEVAMVRGEGV